MIQLSLDDGINRLNSFNYCRGIGWRKEHSIPGGYYILNNSGKFEPREKYRYDIQR